MSERAKKRNHVNRNAFASSRRTLWINSHIPRLWFVPRRRSFSAAIARAGAASPGAPGACELIALTDMALVRTAMLSCIVRSSFSTHSRPSPPTHHRVAVWPRPTYLAPSARGLGLQYDSAAELLLALACDISLPAGALLRSVAVPCLRQLALARFSRSNLRSLSRAPIPSSWLRAITRLSCRSAYTTSPVSAAGLSRPAQSQRPGATPSPSSSAPAPVSFSTKLRVRRPQRLVNRLLLQCVVVAFPMRRRLSVAHRTQFNSNINNSNNNAACQTTSRRSSCTRALVLAHVRGLPSPRHRPRQQQHRYSSGPLPLTAAPIPPPRPRPLALAQAVTMLLVRLVAPRVCRCRRSSHRSACCSRAPASPATGTRISVASSSTSSARCSSA